MAIDPVTPNTRSKLLADVPHDLTVRFDDGSAIEAHALILVLASPVFRELLTNDDGGMRTEIQLAGKSSAEFLTFLQALLPASLRFNALTDEATYFVLCRWAHEFEVDALRTLCEDHLLKSVAVVESSLEHALTYRLERRLSQCIEVMKQDLPRYADVLGQLACEETSAQLEELWPLLCSAANAGEVPMPSIENVASMWPFVAASIRKQGTVSAIQAELKKAVTERVTEVASVVTETTSTWSSSLYDHFWKRAAYAQEQLKSMMTSEVGIGLSSNQVSNGGT